MIRWERKFWTFSVLFCVNLVIQKHGGGGDENYIFLLHKVFLVIVESHVCGHVILQFVSSWNLCRAVQFKEKCVWEWYTKWGPFSFTFKLQTGKLFLSRGQFKHFIESSHTSNLVPLLHPIPTLLLLPHVGMRIRKENPIFCSCWNAKYVLADNISAHNSITEVLHTKVHYKWSN